jgi:hypothetical protein
MDHLVVDGKLALYLSPAEALVKELPPLKWFSAIACYQFRG